MYDALEDLATRPLASQPAQYILRLSLTYGIPKARRSASDGNSRRKTSRSC